MHRAKGTHHGQARPQPATRRLDTVRATARVARVRACITVAEVGPDRIDDYFALFDRAFADNPQWDGCYCAYYDDRCADEDWDPSADRTLRRQQRAARLGSGAAHGLLAYADGIPVGWCNVTPRSAVVNLRAYARAIEDPSDDPAVIMCFVIDPEHRRRGVATALLAGALAAARRWGSPWLEAYPRKPDGDVGPLLWTAAAYKGPLGIYLAAGFRITRDLGPGYVVRHDLS